MSVEEGCMKSEKDRQVFIYILSLQKTSVICNKSQIWGTFMVNQALVNSCITVNKKGFAC